MLISTFPLLFILLRHGSNELDRSSATERSSPVMLSAAKHLCALNDVLQRETRTTTCHAERSEASVWLGEVKNKTSVVTGAFAGALLGFIVILGWVGTLIYTQPLPNANPPATFFGSVLMCSVLGLAAAIILDLVVARRNRRDYRRPSAVAHE